MLSILEESISSLPLTKPPELHTISVWSKLYELVVVACKRINTQKDDSSNVFTLVFMNSTLVTAVHLYVNSCLLLIRNKVYYAHFTLYGWCEWCL